MTTISDQTKIQHRIYNSNPSYYDEMIDENGMIRDHCLPLLNSLTALNDFELNDLNKQAHRLIRENGVTYDVHGDNFAGSRPWNLDTIPLILSPAEWQKIECGLIQRGELLNLILTDFYGKRTLINSGLIPPELVFSQGGFLNQCNNVFLPDQYQLMLYSADIARGADSNWWVINDRTQVPIGMGYALENRTITAQLLPNLIKECSVHRLSNFFQTFRTTLESTAPKNINNPRIVVLSRGPREKSYFENAYLTTYLGYTLVQGDDLTVRDGKVWLKSIDELNQVDIILRRIEDRMCDPLELIPDSKIGVTGLLESARRGNVSIVNPLGSSVLENPGMMAFLPSICQHLLGEDLKLASAATWWCGQNKELTYVLENLDNLAIKPIYRHQETDVYIGSMLSRKQKEKLIAKIKARPHMFVGQELIRCSTSPAMVNGKLEPRQTVLRSFLLGGGSGFTAMPGGLTLCSPSEENIITDYDQGGTTKDVWVLSEKTEPHISLWNTNVRLDNVADSANILTSRAAENLFLVGRYAERAECTARLFRRILQELQGNSGLGNDTNYQSVNILYNCIIDIEEQNFDRKNSKPIKDSDEFADSLMDLAFGNEEMGPLSGVIRLFVNAAFAVRERWSTDSWRIINCIEQHCSQVHCERGSDLDDVTVVLNSLIGNLTSFAGLNVETMTREYGWMMLDIGRRIERAVLLVNILKKSLVPGLNDYARHHVQEAILSALECLITYRRRYRAHLRLGPVLELLLLDESNPRSLVYQLNVLYQHFKTLPQKRTIYRISSEEKIILKASTQLKVADVNNLMNFDKELNCHLTLNKILDRQNKYLSSAVKILTATFFSHVKNPKQLVPINLSLD